MGNYFTVFRVLSYFCRPYSQHSNILLEIILGWGEEGVRKVGVMARTFSTSQLVKVLRDFQILTLLTSKIGPVMVWRVHFDL